jgi:hypothetical protein
MSITTPTIHMNGSDAATLLEEYVTADAAAYQLLCALSGIDFNARDYYPQGPAAFEAARTEMRARYLAVQNIRTELHQVMDSILKQREAK